MKTTRKAGQNINDTNLGYTLLWGTRYSHKERLKLDEIGKLFQLGDLSLDQAMKLKKELGIK